MRNYYKVWIKIRTAYRILDRFRKDLVVFHCSFYLFAKIMNDTLESIKWIRENRIKRDRCLNPIKEDGRLLIHSVTHVFPRHLSCHHIFPFHWTMVITTIIIVLPQGRGPRGRESLTISPTPTDPGGGCSDLSVGPNTPNFLDDYDGTDLLSRRSLECDRHGSPSRK